MGKVTVTGSASNQIGVAISGNSTFNKNSTDYYKNEYQSKLNSEFMTAADAYEIQEEGEFESGIFTPVNVRVNTVKVSATGEKLGDDFKTLLFQDANHTTGVGYKYYFDDNYWLTTISKYIKSVTNSVVVRRCNNVLRWIDSNGVSQSEPCVIDHLINFSRDKNSDPILPQGTYHIYAQLNSKTKKIKGNQRFLFGNSDNWECVKVEGGGVRNWLNNQTSNNNSARVLQLITEMNYVNEETDDVTNGIADAYRNVYQLIISPSAILGNVGDNYQLYPYLTVNNNPTSGSLTYISSKSTTASVSGSGLVSFVKVGSCNITASMKDNEDVNCVVPITISASPVLDYEVRVTPDSGYLLQSNTQIYTAGLYLNGASQTGSFVFSVSGSNVPSSKYELTTISGSAFSLKNNRMFLDYPLLVNVTSGSISKQLSIELKGSW
jgi:hypothetical protein